ncbi:AAA domain-containing protein [Anabaena sp. UHCC 0204]|uniref:AAA domain-containing protein n=1 Tax=Anabaena sp. UHCC 0204 TaxID=2590009 RepID=UPI001448057F|nr:AAA domain-containing protein [Anabaena sp. UHCC 0204]MTJ08555.1 hypothetical protein [Anabaena sp. UHCC 0204]
MNEQEFWQKLQQLIYQSGEISETTQAQWEKLVEIHDSPSLPTQLIMETVCNSAVYLNERSHLNFPAITPHISLSGNQQIALEMALSNSPISLISGTAATGKTRIVNNLAHAAINHSHRVLILTHHTSSLAAYRNLTTYPFLLSQEQDYYQWIINQLRSQHLAQPQMDYLPLHLLPDAELAKLRTPAKLEKWLPIIENNSYQQLTELLKPEYPHLPQPRIQLLAYRLKQLAPLLQQQLKLSQIYNNLSEQGIKEIADQLMENPQIPIVGTVEEFMHPKNQLLWQTNFDLILIEEAQYLTWIELILLSGLCQKLVLFGEEISKYYPNSNKTNLFFANFFDCFKWLKQHLFPTYVYQLKEQFRLHQEIAKLVYPGISNDSIQTQSSNINSYLPETPKRLVWQDVPHENAREQIIKFIQSLNTEISSQIGIIAFSMEERDYLKDNLSKDYDRIFIDIATEWTGSEREIIIVNCSDHPENIPVEYINIALTRAKDYLFLFGDYDLWKKHNSPIQSLLYQRELYKERLVII